MRRWYHFQDDIKWIEVMFVFLFHVIAIYGFLTFPYIKHYKTFIWGGVSSSCAIFGISAGAHRLWTHKSYEAILPFRILLAIFYIASGQLRLTTFVMIHRLHHKYTDTDADPHNSNRGFFYSHLGWFMVKRSKEVHNKWKKIDLTDVNADPVVRFCERYYKVLRIIFTVIVPTLVPVYFWNESWYYALLVTDMRLIWTLNITVSVNSFSHKFGYKPYDKYSLSTDSMWAIFFTLGESWHNFHHAFPYDYRSSEFGWPIFDVTGTILRVCEKIGFVYNLKTAPDSLIEMTANRRGDGSRFTAAAAS